MILERTCVCTVDDTTVVVIVVVIEVGACVVTTGTDGSNLGEISSLFLSQNRVVRFSHIVYEHRALITDACLQIRVSTEYDMSKCWRNRRVECATKPLAPTSSVNNLQVHPAVFASVTKEAYLRSFLASAFGMPSSAPRVSSNIIM